MRIAAAVIGTCLAIGTPPWCLGGGQTVRGGLERALLVVAVVDPLGEPVANAKVEVVQADAPSQIQETKASGFARFTVVRSKKCDVLVTLEGFLKAKREKVSLDGRGPTVLGVALALPEHCGSDDGVPGVGVCM